MDSLNCIAEQVWNITCEPCLVINKGTIGGLANTTREVVNYPGYMQVSGPDLMKDFQKHAERFEVEFLKEEVLSVDFFKMRKSLRPKNKKNFPEKLLSLPVAVSRGF